MTTRLFTLLMLLSLPALLVSQMGGCFTDFIVDNTGNEGDGNDTTGGGDDTTGGGGGGGDLTIVKTAIAVRHDAGLLCGDDLIAFGTNGTPANDSSNVGVSYVFPSTHPTAGTPVPSAELYDNSDFAVGGRTIFLAGSNTGSLAFQVSVFNADSATITKTFPASEIRLSGIPVTQDEPRNIRADGNYCIVICDQNEVDDGKIIKVIDVSSGTPTLIALDNPIDYANGVKQVAVDAEWKKAVAVVHDDVDSFYIWYLDDPTAAPTVIPTQNGVNDTQIKIQDGYIIAFDDQNYPMAFLVDLNTDTIMELTDAEATYGAAIGGDKFAFFAYHDSDDAHGGHQRAAVGTVPGPSFDKHALNDYIDGSTGNNGLVGFAGTMCITPDGSKLFLADWYLQYSNANTSFVVPKDPDGTDPWACPAWDIDCSADTVGFKTATDRTLSQDTTLGYIVLQ